MSSKKKKNKVEQFIPLEDLVPKNGKSRKKKIARYVILFFALVICFLIEFSDNSKNWNHISKAVTVNQNVIEEAGKFYLHFIDVGQAECELLKCNDDTVLVDAGDVDSFEKISSYLDSQNVKELDYLIITHMHSDHMGSAKEVIEKYKPENIIMTRLTESVTPTTDIYKELLEVLSECDSKIIAAKPGNSYELDSFSFVILAPNKNYEELNNTSVVIKAYFGDTTYLLQGDAETESEKDILSNGFEVNADVLKLGHHGSKTSTCADYLNAVKPQVAVVNCGKENKYNHPNNETLDKLESRGIHCFRTDKNGNIVIKSDGKAISVITER